MNRAEALKILRIDAEHDAHSIEQSYWSLVRRAQAQRNEHAAQRDIERLNAAYSTLAPHPEPMTASSHRPATSPSWLSQTALSSEGLPEIVLASVATEFEAVRRRWVGRLPEIGVLCACVTALTIVAVAAGANWLLALVLWFIAAVAVWSPWREHGMRP